MNEIKVLIEAAANGNVVAKEKLLAITKDERYSKEIRDKITRQLNMISGIIKIDSR